MIKIIYQSDQDPSHKRWFRECFALSINSEWSDVIWAPKMIKFKTRIMIESISQDKKGSSILLSLQIMNLSCDSQCEFVVKFGHYPISALSLWPYLRPADISLLLLFPPSSQIWPSSNICRVAPTSAMDSWLICWRISAKSYLCLHADESFLKNAKIVFFNNINYSPK